MTFRRLEQSSDYEVALAGVDREDQSASGLNMPLEIFDRFVRIVGVMNDTDRVDHVELSAQIHLRDISFPQRHVAEFRRSSFRYFNRIQIGAHHAPRVRSDKSQVLAAATPRIENILVAEVIQRIGVDPLHKQRQRIILEFPPLKNPFLLLLLRHRSGKALAWQRI